jgi:hypothetical protein
LDSEAASGIFSASFVVLSLSEDLYDDMIAGTTYDYHWVFAITGQPVQNRLFPLNGEQRPG